VLEGLDATSEQVEDAIALQPTAPQRQQLTQWLRALSNPESLEEAIAAHSSSAWHEKIRAYGELLIEGFACGLEVVKLLLEPWSHDERLAAISKAGEMSPEAMEKLCQIEPNWTDLCVVC
jgi:hypothetical protein